jgi:hypothetical protein
MKKIILLLSFVISLSACSSLELQEATSSEKETQRILALGLTHEENLAEAKKLSDSHMVTVVSLQLTNAHDDKIQAEIDSIESNKIANNVFISSDGLNFIGPKVSKSETSIINTNPDQINYHIKGSKNLSTGKLDHQLQLLLVHNSDKKRNFITATLCDQWGRCDGDSLEINNISATPSNCSSYSCDYQEIVELDLADSFLRDNINKSITIQFNSTKKRSSTKVKVSKVYLMGYLKVAQ